MNPALALFQGLRRRGDEAQLTQALASVFKADGRSARQFLRLALERASGQPFEVPELLRVTAEEVSAAGRFDLRFRSLGWDVIVELKIHAGYGKGQLKRYLTALDDVENSYLLAVTRDVPLYGEPPAGPDPRWLGSLRWRELLPGLRELQFEDDDLRRQWPLLLEVLETEGSMGFNRPDPALFSAWGLKRQASEHVEDFVEAVRWPVLAALRDVLGGGETSADFYRGRGGRAVLSRGHWGKADMPIRVPADGEIRLRTGLFAYDPPTRFYVSPHNGRRWVAGFTKLPSDGQEAVRALLARGFRESDLHSFLVLDEERLASSTLEEDVVTWVHGRFADFVDSGFLSVSPPPGRRGRDDDDLVEEA